MDRRPNFVFIMTDQQRFDSLGCYGAPGVHTPNLDRLASEGILYEQCYVNNPLCLPSRASIWTGKHLPGHQAYNNDDNLPADEILFSERLQDAGYDTALIGKLHVTRNKWEELYRHNHDGFRVYEWCLAPFTNFTPMNSYANWLAEKHPDFLARQKEKKAFVGDTPLEAHMTTWVADRTIDFLKNGRDKSKPFFVNFSVFDPHNPYWNYPYEMRDLIDEENLQAPVGLDESFEHRPVALQRYGKHSYMHNYMTRYIEWHGKQPYEDIVREWRVGYHAAVALIDMQVGRLLEVLREEGLEDNTIIIFVSDHGDMMGDHNMFAKGPFFYDPCARVPLIVRYPGSELPKGTRIPSLCQPHDIAATCLLAAGFSPEQLTDCMPESLNLVDVGALNTRGYAAGMHMGRDTLSSNNYDGIPVLGTMWREGRYKLNLWRNPGSARSPIEGELYDMESDPQELQNLWQDKKTKDLQDEMTRKTMDWLLRQEFYGHRGRQISYPPL